MTTVFWQGGKIHELDRSQSDRSLLDYLRVSAGVKAVKEGCAQGDCGACALVLVTDNGAEEPQIRPVNACIKPLISVNQSLVFCASDLEADHPVIQVMLQSDASQCGFCTPGFVMSLYAAFLQARQRGLLCVADREAAVEIFSGNLCRCTGYVSLIEAALAIDGQASPGHDWLAPIREGLDALKRFTSESSLRREQAWIDPLESCLREKRDHPNALFVAGATDLGLQLSRKHEKPEALFDLCSIPELMGSAHDDAGWRIGAARPLQSVFEEMLAYWPEIDDYLDRFAGRPIRSSASLGGNLASASPIGDCIPLLWALDAQLRLKSWDQHAQIICERSLSLDQFIKGYRQTDLNEHELIESIWIPASSKNHKLYARKISKRWEDDIASVSLVIGFSINERGLFGDLAIAFGGVAEQVIFAKPLEDLLLGQAPADALVAKANAVLQTLIRPIDDARASAAYRRAICSHLFEDFIASITRQAKEARQPAKDQEEHALGMQEFRH